MLAYLAKQPAQAHNTGTVETQGYNGGTTGWRQPHYLCKVLCPDEMLLPPLLARMKKQHFLGVYRIEGRDYTVELVAVTA